MRVLAVALGILGVVDAWGAWHATVPGGPRAAPGAGRRSRSRSRSSSWSSRPWRSRIVVFVAAIGWIAVGLIALAAAVLPSGLRTPTVGRRPGWSDIVDAWLRGRDVGDARRDEILDAYDYDTADRDKLVRFSVLLILAGIIASAGLISNSVASIIGAMIIAPLMGPIVGIALGIVTGLPGAGRPVADRRHRRHRWSTILIGVAMGAWLGTAPNVPYEQRDRRRGPRRRSSTSSSRSPPAPPAPTPPRMPRSPTRCPGWRSRSRSSRRSGPPASCCRRGCLRRPPVRSCCSPRTSCRSCWRRASCSS